MGNPDYKKLQERRKKALEMNAGGADNRQGGLPVLETSPHPPIQGSLLPPYEPQEEYFHDKVLRDFQDMAANKYEEREQLSNMFMDWELLPRYNGTRLAGVSSKGSIEPLPIISHLCDPNRDVKMVLTPAQIKEKDADGVERTRFYYPGETENLVEWALIKMATEKAACLPQRESYGSIIYGVEFSLSGLRNMMYSFRRGRSYRDLVRALEIMNRCHLELQVDGKATAQGALLTTLRSYTENAYKKNSPNSRWFVTFHPLINMGIESRGYRQYNLERLMTTKSAAASELYKEIITKGRNISKTIPYRKSYREFSRATGLLSTKRRSDGIRAYRQVCDELVENGTLARVEYEEIRGQRNRIEDVISIKYPSDELIAEVKAAHYRQNQIEERHLSLALDK